jgi:DnaJ-class molecular chaperone
MRQQTYTIEEASKILRIKLPTTPNALKSAFRRRSREVHPDHSVAVDAKEQFQALLAAYEYVQIRPEWLMQEYEGPSASSLCEDGTPLSALGQGLGPTTNGRPCDGCDSKGFTSYSAEQIQCRNCRASGIASSFVASVEYRCRRCGGDGTFKRGGKAVGQCNGCRGAGWILERGKKRTDAFGVFGGFHTVPVNRCVTCRGRGTVKNPRGRMLHQKCTGCKGTGEILVFNPVIPKGLLGSRR